MVACSWSSKSSWVTRGRGGGTTGARGSDRTPSNSAPDPCPSGCGLRCYADPQQGGSGRSHRPVVGHDMAQVGDE
jgi:hypothetical protein